MRDLEALLRKTSCTLLLHPCHRRVCPPAIHQQFCIYGATFTARKSILGEESSGCNGTVQLPSCSGTSSYYRTPRYRETRSDSTVVRYYRHCASSSNPRPDTAYRARGLRAEAPKIENKEAKQIVSASTNHISRRPFTERVLWRSSLGTSATTYGHRR